MNKESNKSKHRFLNLFMFPWGILSLSAVVYPVAYLILQHILFLSYWVSLVIYAGVFIVIVIIICVVNFGIEKPIKGMKNIYIMLYPPEDADIDKFVHNDMKDYFIKKDKNINYVVSNYFRRCQYYKKSRKHQGDTFLKTRFLKRIMKKTKADVIIGGSIKKRKQEKELYVINLDVVYKMNISDSKAETRTFIQQMINTSFSSTMCVALDNELNGYRDLVTYISDFANFIMGLAEASMGEFEKAYEIHSKLYYNMKSWGKFNKQKVALALIPEVNVLYLKCIAEKDFLKSREFINVLKELNMRDIVYLETQQLMLETKNAKEMKKNAILCQKMLGKNRTGMAFISSKAYVCMLLGRYKKSESLYNSFFSSLNKIQGTMISILFYCNVAIEKDYEKVYALYLMGMIYFYYYKDYKIAIEKFEQVKLLQNDEDYLYKKSVEFINLANKHIV